MLPTQLTSIMCGCLPPQPLFVSTAVNRRVSFTSQTFSCLDHLAFLSAIIGILASYHITFWFWSGPNLQNFAGDWLIRDTVHTFLWPFSWLLGASIRRVPWLQLLTQPHRRRSCYDPGHSDRQWPGTRQRVLWLHCSSPPAATATAAAAAAAAPGNTQAGADSKQLRPARHCISHSKHRYAT